MKLKAEIHGWLCVASDSLAEDRPCVVFFDFKPTGGDWIPIHEHTIREDLGDFDPRPQAIAAIDAEIVSVRAKMTKRVTELQEARAKLLCLENAA